MHHHACAKGGRGTARFIIAAVITGLTFISAGAGYGQTITTSALSPGAVVDDASFGGASWSPPANATASDDLWASVTPSGSPTHYLKATSFNFAIPAPAQILGIEVLVERHSAISTIVDNRARIVKGGVIGTAERALPGVWPMVDATVTYGGTSDLWGDTWTPADINSSGFGFALSVDDNVDSAAVDHISIQVTYSLCATTPAAGCRTALKSILVVKDNATNSKDKLVWKWIKGTSTTTAEFGDPVMGTANIALCVYDATGKVGEAAVLPGPPWANISTKGWKFKDKAGTQDGIQKIILKASTNNKAKALVKGKGANLPDITPPLTLPVTVQLVNSESGLCWEGVFNSQLKNVAGTFKAKQ